VRLLGIKHITGFKLFSSGLEMTFCKWIPENSEKKGGLTVTKIHHRIEGLQ
jgi:hypothetical protein